MSFSLLVQHLLPHRLLSRLVYWATRWELAPWKDFLIGQITRRYAVDMSETEQPDPFAYPHFNAFFTRALKAGARSFDAPADALLCPADGRVSQAGLIADGRILQAKGQSYTAGELLGDELSAAPYRDGRFATVYLAPRDYHRVHMPLSGTLRETVHVPGRLFSVAPFAVAGIPRLFARNERLVCHFDGDKGPFVVVLVGAMLVSSVTTVWNGLEIPPYASRPIRRDWRGRGLHLPRGAELGRFNMGSTVIVLLPPGPALDAGLQPLVAVRVGQPIGRFD
ncbi:archaetidylserine decarboxylase [Dokdonella koreensis]|uniref:Phosphatidylserine decarboxylase proenzyme n=1 Tax=Dokdonella koreensis DS-123 TaxID=1300342 RepID=A0A167GUF8_9GAMM|nr:archaetidylserine decarboxylase [Dokdonella koreensis]ANB17692.1 Phosphatidylserine decarboxylase proenzyme [Dokdonella koreensis DS-123]